MLPIAAITKHRLPFAALAIGSMVPDLPVFFPLYVFSPIFGGAYYVTHSVRGILVCAVIGLPLYWLYERLLKSTLVAMLPQWFRRRLDTKPQKFSFRHSATQFISLAIGAATHSFWDSFTHADRWGTRLLPALQSNRLNVFGLSLPWFKVFQYGSTLVFLPLLIWLAYRRLARAEPIHQPFAFSFRARVGIIATTAAVLAGITAWNVAFYDSNYLRLGGTIKTSGAFLLVALIALASFTQARFGDAMGQLRSTSHVDD